MRFLQCSLCPTLIDSYKQNCGYELYSKEVIVPGFKSPRLRRDKVWFHLDCYYNRRYNKWGSDDPPRVNGESCIIKTEPTLVPVSLKPERLPKRQSHTDAPFTDYPPSERWNPNSIVSEMIQAGNIAIDGGKLKVKDVKSESMSKYFEDVSLKEVSHASDKAMFAIRKRFAKDEDEVEVEDAEADEYEEGITRNIKIIEGVDENGKLILREVKVKSGKA